MGAKRRLMPYGTFKVLSHMPCGVGHGAYWLGLFKHWFRVNNLEWRAHDGR